MKFGTRYSAFATDFIINLSEVKVKNFKPLYWKIFHL